MPETTTHARQPSRRVARLVGETFARLAMVLAVVALLAGCHPGPPPVHMTFPKDLEITATAGSLVPGRASCLVSLSADGTGRYALVRDDAPGPPLQDTTFVVAHEALDSLWALIDRHDFFSLEARYAGDDVHDGFFYDLTITANKRSHQVQVENVTVPAFDVLIDFINEITPAGMDLRPTCGDTGT